MIHEKKGNSAEIAGITDLSACNTIERIFYVLNTDLGRGAPPTPHLGQCFGCFLFG